MVKHKNKSIIFDVFEKLATGKILLILFVLIIPVFLALIRPGYFFMQDDLQAFRIHQMDKCFKDFQIPCRWVPDAGYGYGYPQFLFYAPGVYYLGEIIHLSGFQFIDTTKILFILGYILSAFSMYILVKELFGKTEGFVAGILYTYVPYKAVEVYVRGALSEFWSFVFFPLIFWSIYKLIKEEKARYFIYLTFFLAFLLLTHNLMPLVFLPLAIVWGLVLLIRKKSINAAKLLFGATILGIFLSAFFTLPVVIERKYVHSESLLGGYFDYRQHFVSLRQLFLTNNWEYGSSELGDKDELNLSVGYVQWAVSLAGLAFALVGLKKKNKEKSILVITLFIFWLYSLFMMHLKSSVVWGKLSFFQWLQFPWRFMSASVFLTALLGGAFISYLNKFKILFSALVIIVAMLLVGRFFVPRDWEFINDNDKFSGQSWIKQITISIFDYTPIWATLPPWDKAPDYPEILDSEGEFINYFKGSDYQIGLLYLEEKSTIRLPLFDFPGMVAYVDGVQVSHYHDDCSGQRYCLGLITFDVEKGIHRVAVKLTNTKVRTIGEAISICAVLIISLVYYYNEKNTKRNKK